MCGSAVIDVQCEQEGAEHTALGSDAVLTERQPDLSGVCMRGSLISYCRWSYAIIYHKSYTWQVSQGYNAPLILPFPSVCREAPGVCSHRVVQ